MNTQTNESRTAEEIIEGHLASYFADAGETHSPATGLARMFADHEVEAIKQLARDRVHEVASDIMYSLQKAFVSRRQLPTCDEIVVWVHENRVELIDALIEALVGEVRTFGDAESMLEAMGARYRIIGGFHPSIVIGATRFVCRCERIRGVTYDWFGTDGAPVAGSTIRRAIAEQVAYGDDAVVIDDEVFESVRKDRSRVERIARLWRELEAETAALEEVFAAHAVGDFLEAKAAKLSQLVDEQHAEESDRLLEAMGEDLFEKVVGSWRYRLEKIVRDEVQATDVDTLRRAVKFANAQEESDWIPATGESASARDIVDVYLACERLGLASLDDLRELAPDEVPASLQR